LKYVVLHLMYFQLKHNIIDRVARPINKVKINIFHRHFKSVIVLIVASL